jgi:hypothetical protein
MMGPKLAASRPRDRGGRAGARAASFGTTANAADESVSGAFAGRRACYGDFLTARVRLISSLSLRMSSSVRRGALFAMTSRLSPVL